MSCCGDCQCDDGFTGYPELGYLEKSSNEIIIGIGIATKKMCYEYEGPEKSFGAEYCKQKQWQCGSSNCSCK